MSQNPVANTNVRASAGRVCHMPQHSETEAERRDFIKTTVKMITRKGR